MTARYPWVFPDRPAAARARYNLRQVSKMVNEQEAPQVWKEEFQKRLDAVCRLLDEEYQIETDE